jgi:outer membrane protein assembly factor BamE (lipoprotein component of BamABCDE complex)
MKPRSRTIREHGLVSRLSHAVRVTLSGVLFAVLLLGVAACNHSVGSKLSQGNVDKITPGMSKSQVEQILGKPTRIDDKDFLIMHKATWRYEDGDRFVMVTFKNDEVDSKDSNLATR